MRDIRQIPEKHLTPLLHRNGIIDFKIADGDQYLQARVWDDYNRLRRDLEQKGDLPDNFPQLNREEQDEVTTLLERHPKGDEAA